MVAMKILFISHYYYPEGNAPATRVHQMTRRWADAGHEVTVITAFPNVPSGVVYEGYRNRWRREEQVDGVKVIRVWTYLAANAGKIRRIVSYLSFMTTSLLAGVRASRPDVVIATSPQFFCGWSGRLVAGLRRLPFVLEIRDLWPESIVAVGAMRPSPAIRTLAWLERRLYRAADLIVTVGDGYRRKLLERGANDTRIRIVPNGVDLEHFQRDIDGSAVRIEFLLEDRFVCAFVGTIGMASGLDVVVRAARRLRDDGRDDVRFLLVGDGAERKRLALLVEEERLSSIVMTGRLPKERMPEVIAASDACLVHLRETDLFRTVMPSKMFEAAAMERPIIVGVDGEARSWVEQAEAGRFMHPENADDLVVAIDRLAGDRSLAARYGRNGRRFVEQHHDHEILAARYLDLLRSLPDGNQAS